MRAGDKPADPERLRGSRTSIAFDKALERLRDYYLYGRSGALAFHFHRGQARKISEQTDTIPEEQS